MQIYKTELNDCYQLLYDKKGNDKEYYVYYYLKDVLKNKDLDNLFSDISECKIEKLSKGTLKGLDYQKEPYTQSRLISTLNGLALDIAVDLRTNSSTFGKYTSALLDPYLSNQILVPRGFANGILALEDNTILETLTDNVYNFDSVDGIKYNDSDLDIPWDSIFYEYDIYYPSISMGNLDYDTLSMKLSKNEINFKK